MKFTLLNCCYNAGWALKCYTRNFANVRLTVDLDTVCFRNMVGDCFDMFTSGKPVFKAYQCHITIPTKLTIPPRTEDFYFSKLILICPSHSVGHTVILSVIRSYCRPYGHSVDHTDPVMVACNYILLLVFNTCEFSLVFKSCIHHYVFLCFYTTQITKNQC